MTQDLAGHGFNWYRYSDGNPVTGADPLGEARIEVRYRPVMMAGGLAYHMYIVIIDNDPRSPSYGQEYAISGGPENGGTTALSNPGRLVDRSGPHGPGGFDYTDDPGSHTRVLVLSDDIPFDVWVARAKRAASKVSGRLVYSPVNGPNSNTFAMAVLRRLGLLNSFYEGLWLMRFRGRLRPLTLPERPPGYRKFPHLAPGWDHPGFGGVETHVGG